MSRGYVSIGAGVINKEYMKNYDKRMYHSYERIINQVEEFRKVANDYFEENYKRDESSIAKRVKPNNTIAIIGDRGVGKTSLMLTLLNELQWNEDGKIEKTKNIILPIIDPEKFNAEKSALGWVIFCFEEILDKYDDGNEKFCSKKEKEFQELKAIYGELKRIYINSREYSRMEKTNFISGNSEYNKIVENTIFADMLLAKRTEEFISKFIHYIKNNNGDNNQPLIFITFDDIDLCAEQGMKILNTILEYLSHPAIVTIVLGKLENFISGIESEITKLGKVYELESDRLANKFNSNKTTIEILKKGLPPFFRNYIKKLSYAEIMKFVPYGNQNIYKDTFEEKLRKVKINNDNKYQLIDYFDLKSAIVFMDSTEFIKNHAIEFIENSKGIYAEILPQIPRDAINFYFSIGEIIDEENKFDQFIILYDYFYNIMEHKKNNINYLDEIFLIDRTKKQIEIKNRFNSIVLYVGKIENYIDDNISRDNYWIKDAKNFIQEIYDFREGHFLKEYLFGYQNISRYSYEKIERMNIFDIILEAVNNKKYNKIPYSDEIDYGFEKISIRYHNIFNRVERDAETEQEVDAKHSINLILFTMDRVFDNTKLYFNKKNNGEELKVRTGVEKELVKEIKDDISIIKYEIIKLEKILVNVNSEKKRIHRKKEEVEKETIKAIMNGSSNIRLYDEFYKTEINDDDGLIIQFLFDVAIGMRLISKDILKYKMEKVADAMKKRLHYYIESELFFKEYNIEKFLNYYIYTVIENNQVSIVDESMKYEELKAIKKKIQIKIKEKNDTDGKRNIDNIEEKKANDEKAKSLESDIEDLKNQESSLIAEINEINLRFEERRDIINKLEIEIKDRE